LLLERLATLTERLNQVFSDKNQRSIEGILSNSERLTSGLANAAPQVEGTLAELQVTLKEAGEALDAFEKATATTDKLINEEGVQLARQLRATLKSTDAAAASLSATLEDARPAARQLSQSTLPATEATLQELRAASKSLRSLTEKLENQGVGPLIQGQSLPDYKP